MSFEVRIQLRDTTIQCVDEDRMNRLFDGLVERLTAIGVPSDNIILIGAELSQCDKGFTHNHVIRRHPPVPETE